MARAVGVVECAQHCATSLNRDLRYAMSIKWIDWSAGTAAILLGGSSMTTLGELYTSVGKKLPCGTAEEPKAFEDIAGLPR